jgi:hypothetical protein
VKATRRAGDDDAGEARHGWSLIDGAMSSSHEF